MGADVVPLASKGQLRPNGGGASVQRVALPPRFADVARQVWVPRWSVPAGGVLVQPILQYPAVNVAVEADVAAVYLPASGLGQVDLVGSGWAAGVLLRPGAGTLVVPGDHSTMLGRAVPIPEGGELVTELRATMPDGTIDDALVAYEKWLDPLLDRVNDGVRLVNAIADAAEHDAQITSVRDLAERFALGERRLQRLIRSRIGFSPRWLIQRRRIHDAAERLRNDRAIGLAQVAAELGYADQAHLTRDFGATIGMTPVEYRNAVCSDD